MYFLQNTSLTQEEKAEAIRTWGLPFFAVLAKLVYPTEEVLRGLVASIRRAMGVRPMGMTTAILQRPLAEGGAALCTARTYPLFHHASYYQRMITRTEDLSTTQKEEFDGWRGTLLKNELEMKMVNWDRNPPPQTQD